MATSTNRMALSATIHCLTGCAIGEVSGMIIGTAYGLSNHATVILAIILAFLFGYALSAWSLIKSGVALPKVLTTVLAADTISITVMEIVDNAVLITIPGALDAHLTHPLFWGALGLSLFVAFWAAFPVNRYLLLRGKGHALIHQAHSGSHTHPADSEIKTPPEHTH